MSMKIISTEVSPCCGADAQIVRSREGGFISRNCTLCGERAYVKPRQIPQLPCSKCSSKLTVAKLDGSNYFYLCSGCGWNRPIASLVPDWREVSEYHGLAAYGDGVEY